MLVIPESQLAEWNAEYNRLHVDSHVSRLSFMAHCAAVWGYNQGLTAMNSLFRIDPEFE